MTLPGNRFSVDVIQGFISRCKWPMECENECWSERPAVEWQRKRDPEKMGAEMAVPVLDNPGHQELEEVRTGSPTASVGSMATMAFDVRSLAFRDVREWASLLRLPRRRDVDDPLARTE